MNNKQLVSIDFNKNQALNMVLHNNPGSLTTTASGQTYYDTIDHTVYTYAPSNPSSVGGWLNLGSTGITNLTWTASTSTVHSSTGTNAILTLADITNPGLLSTAHWNYLENPTMVGMTGTKAQFNTALSDGTFLFTGDADNYGNWILYADGTNRGNISSGEIVNFSGGTGLQMVYTTTNDNTITFNVDYTGTDNVIDSAPSLEGSPIDVADTIIYHDATDNNVKKGLVSDLPFNDNPLPNDATITIGGGAGLTDTPGSFTTNQSGNDTITLDVGAGVGIIVNANDVAVDYLGTNNFMWSAPLLTSPATADYIVYHDVTDNNVKRALISSLPFNNNTYTATLTAGTGLVGTAGNYTPSNSTTFNLALDELPVSTMVTGDWIAFDDAGTSSKALIQTIPLGIFDNDQGWENGTVTSVGITGTDFDITNTPITTSGNIGLSIKADAVTNAKLANMAANTIKGNDTASPTNPTDIAMVANSVLLRAGGNIEDFIVTINTVLGRVGGNIQNIAIDSDLTAVSASDDTLASAKAIKDYVDTAVTGALVYQGGYDAGANSPDLDVSPDSGITQGWTYTVTVSGTFFTTAVAVGDLLIAETDSPTVEADWTIVNKAIPDIVDATTSVKGIVRLATIAETNTGTSELIALTPDGLDGWTGSGQLVTVGTIGSGTWQGTNIDDSRIAFTDITTGNSTISAHGYLPKLSNVVTEYMNGQGGWSTPPNTNQLTTFNLAGDTGTPETIAHGNTLSILGTPVISTVVSATDTITISHDNVSRSDATSNASPAHGATFDVVDSVTSTSQGHITAINVKTVTLPSNDGTVKKYAANLTGSTTSYAITNATHGLGTSGDFQVQVKEVSTGDFVDVGINTNGGTGTVTVYFNIAPATNEYRIIITG
jgi:hypothetical protein